MKVRIIATILIIPIIILIGIWLTLVGCGEETENPTKLSSSEEPTIGSWEDGMGLWNLEPELRLSAAQNQKVNPFSIDQAITATQRFIDGWDNPDLRLSEVIEFTNHFYAAVEEESTSIYAFELLISKRTGNVFYEPGPNLMWNLKYGHMGHMEDMGMEGMGMAGMMGGWNWNIRNRGWNPEGMMGMMGKGRFGQPGPDWGNWPMGIGGVGVEDLGFGAEMPISAEDARAKAQRFLDLRLPGKRVSGEVDPFYGYYTIEVLAGDKIYGMLSVNGYSGLVWYHNWHGKFIRSKSLE